MKSKLHRADCLEWLDSQPPNSYDLVFGSPPYPGARDYGIGFDLEGEAWVEWMSQVVKSSLRVCRGLVLFVIDGHTRKYRWSAEPALLMADLHRAGVVLRKPPVYLRAGIPGSGGPDWLSNGYEPIVACTNGGRLPWADPTAMGHPPKYKPGGEPSYRLRDGRRANDRPRKPYAPPKLANPGNVIKCSVGGGHLGSDFAHKNEAPFPEALAEFFIRSFCPPGGRVLDPFCGSGTTLAVADRLGRESVGVDIRQSQIDLSRARLEAQKRERQAEGEPAVTGAAVPSDSAPNPFRKRRRAAKKKKGGLAAGLRKILAKANSDKKSL